MVASLTPLPVVGVPVRASVLDGLDSLLSIVQVLLFSNYRKIGSYYCRIQFLMGAVVLDYFKIHLLCCKMVTWIRFYVLPNGHVFCPLNQSQNTKCIFWVEYNEIHDILRGVIGFLVDR